MTRLLVNPAAGRGRGAACLATVRRMPELEVRLTSSAADLGREAERVVKDGHSRVLVAGGDGTLHEAIQALAGSACSLGIVPTGSGNDLARALGLPLRAEAAIQRALAGTPRRIDLGRIGTRLFAVAASIGFDAEVARFAREEVRWLRGRWVYLYAALRMLPRFKAPHLSITHDDGSFSGRAMLAVVANARCYGGGIEIAPGAELDDGWLDLVIVRELSPLRLLWLLPRAYRGVEHPHPAIIRSRVRKVVLRCEPASSIFADGEAACECPDSSSGATLEILPQALTVLV